MARLDEKFRLDDPTIRMIMPHWELFMSTGKKIHSWLKTNTDVANNLWRCNLLKIVQQSYSPHSPSCTCTRSHPPPTRPIDLEDIQTLRVVKLNPILTQDDVLIRDSLNGLSVRPPTYGSNLYAPRGRPILSNPILT